MDLWVISQDKKVLKKINELHLEPRTVYDSTLKGICWCIMSDDTVLGEYSTIEKALKIIDNIENFLNLSETSNIIYEIPEEYRRK